MIVLAAVAPIPAHAIFILLVQLSLLLLVARVGAELSKRIGLPAVVGELAAGLVLGPSVFGHYAPGAFAALFPQTVEQFNLLETVGTLGMTLLLLLTGLETDLRLMRNLGRAALVASGCGMLLPFAMGYGLGMWMPAEYLAQPDHRLMFSAFLATAMSISAMPVIAKILMDLDLTKRNIGLVILSAGVVDDTAGWLILSVIAGAASSGAVNIANLGLKLLYLAGFLVIMGVVVYPILRVLMRAATRFKSPDADLVVIIVTTFLSAAVTEWIGVHAVFGAFVTGTILRQTPRLKAETVHKLESFVFAILAPIFFGIVGLRVNLWALGGGYMLGLVLAVAFVGKLVGCTVGGLWGGMRFWEAFSIAVAMNARGAMELVVATIGLSLGILNQQMFSVIVVVAIVTSFVAPLALRLTMRLVRMTDEEAKRILAEESKGAFDPLRMRLLLPTAGGPNALEAARIGFQMARRSASPVEVLYIQATMSLWKRLTRWLSGVSKQTGAGIEEHTSRLLALGTAENPPRIRKLTSSNAPDTIIEEASKGFDVILIGASQRGGSLGGPVLEHVVANSPCHVAVVRASERLTDYKRIMVPVDGSVVSRVAAEFAVRYAEAVGAELTLAVVTEHRPQAIAYANEDRAMSSVASVPVTTPTTSATSGRMNSDRLTLAPTVPMIEQTLEEEIHRISPVFRSTEIKPKLVHLDYDPASSNLRHEASHGEYDLIVLGAENRAIQHRMFFGYENQRLIQKSTVTVVIVIPNIGQLH